MDIIQLGHRYVILADNSSGSPSFKEHTKLTKMITR